jgi:citrate lyase beta subunit
MSERISLSPETLREAAGRLDRVHAEHAWRYPGELERRQPVHTVYGGAHMFRADSAARLGALALQALSDYAPDFVTFARALELPGSADWPSPEDTSDLKAQLEWATAASPAAHQSVDTARRIYERVGEKLRREPVEDFRIDFEDGYGNRTDSEEDGHAASAAEEVATGMAAGTLPSGIGIRIKPFTEELQMRSIRTLDLFVTRLLELGGRLPPNFVVTLPKVTAPEQVALLSDLLEKLEGALRLAPGALRFEIMIETPQSVLAPDGAAAPPRLVAAAGGRCGAAHFGTYDYTASLGITAAHQHMTHPACDFAKHVLKVSLAGTGIWLSDGGTNVLPVPLHRRAAGGPPLAFSQQEENRAAVHAAWRLHYGHVLHSLEGGYYQGWDLHPAQLPTRYAALFAFFLQGAEASSGRLRNFIEKAGRATLVGDVFDDAATGQGLLNYFLRAINCGAMTEEDAVEKSGLTLEELRGRSFVKILQTRRGA